MRSDMTFLPKEDRPEKQEKQSSENKTKSNNLKSLKHYRIFPEIPHQDEKLIRAFFKKY